MYKQLFRSAVILLTVVLQAMPALAKLPTDPQQPSQQTIQQQAWLGVSLGAIPAILRSQLASVIPSGQGVMITAVANNSPAAKAGLQQHDVVLNSGDQKIYSSQQLSGLVKAAQPDSNINLTIVREGKVQDIAVTLGKHNKPTVPYGQQQWPQARSPFGSGWQMPSLPRLYPPALQSKQQSPTSWDSFESVQVKTLPDGGYHAEVKYKDSKNNEKSFAFEGKREEIIKQIKAQKDLPEEKKSALLNALNMNSSTIFKQPFFHQGNLFNDPFFQQRFPALNMPDFQHFFQSPRVSPEAYFKDNVL